MASKNLVGTFYINSNGIGNANAVSWDDLTVLKNNGWSIGNHTHTHQYLTTLTQSEQETEISTTRDAIISHELGDGAYHLAYPYGTYNSTTIQALKNTGIKTARTTKTGSNYIPFNYVLDDNYQLPQLLVGNTVTPATVQSYLDNLINLGDTGILTFHDIVPTATETYQTSITDFQTIMDYISTKKQAGLISDMNIVDWYNYAK